ncbi:MAG TPA: hypothetical protein VFJ09_12915 [Nocardioidaceae bacterium]|nr:hypothetical protein [Nocardioidaceae bacterium]
MRRRTSAIVLVACLLTAAAPLAASATAAQTGAPTGTSASGARQPVTASAGSVPKTRITLRVDRCVHCPVMLVQAFSGPDGHVWQTRQHRVRAGWVSFTVPTRRTVGMSIDLYPRWSKFEAHTNVVIRYARTRVGQRVDAATARHKRRAEGCWAGTTASQVTLRVRVIRFPFTDYAGHHGYAPRAWLARTHEAVPPMVRTTKGAIGNQDAFYCAP